MGKGFSFTWVRHQSGGKVPPSWLTAAVFLFIPCAALAGYSVGGHALSRQELIACTARHVCCDPINIVIIGTPQEMSDAFASIGWCRADRLNVVSAMAMAACVVTDHSYHHAPVSLLYLAGRAQDLCFERTEGSPRRRHHVRFWKSDVCAPDGRPVWLGAATHDTGLRIRFPAGRIVHSIDSDIDAERDALAEKLREAGLVQATSLIDGLGLVSDGHNATGDRYFTDGRIVEAVLNFKVAH